MAGAVINTLFIEVADATPKFGVTKVGEVFITNVVPDPVCEAILVVFPTLVIGPVKFAFVVTVAALPAILVWSPVLVPLRFEPVIVP